MKKTYIYVDGPPPQLPFCSFWQKWGESNTKRWNRSVTRTQQTFSICLTAQWLLRADRLTVQSNLSTNTHKTNIWHKNTKSIYFTQRVTLHTNDSFLTDSFKLFNFSVTSEYERSFNHLKWTTENARCSFMPVFVYKIGTTSAYFFDDR